MNNIFISYSHKDKLFVDFVEEKIKSWGYTYWRDEKDLLAGDSIPAKIGEDLAACSIYLLIISNESLKSSWVEREFNLAVTNWLDSKKEKCCPIPILIDEKASIPMFIKDILYIDFTQNSQLGFEKLKTSLSHKVNKNVRQRLWAISFAIRNDRGMHMIHYPKIWFGDNEQGAKNEVFSWFGDGKSDYDLVEVPAKNIDSNLFIISVVWVKTYTIFGNNPFSTRAYYCNVETEQEARLIADKYARENLQQGYSYDSHVWRISKEVLEALYTTKTYRELSDELS